jgi:hypothetical protein
LCDAHLLKKYGREENVWEIQQTKWLGR